MASRENGFGDAVPRGEEPGVTARPPAAKRARGNHASDSDVPTQMYDPDELLGSSGTLDIEIEGSPNSAVHSTAGASPPQAAAPPPPPQALAEEDREERTCVLDDDMLHSLDAGDIEHPEPSKSGTKSRGGASQPGGTRRNDGRGDDDAFLGRNFGGFRVVRAIAAGGMASIYLGRKEAVGGFTQHAAIKVVHKHFAGEKDFIDMFLDEARIAARIQHPNVCRVLDFGEAERTYFLALEYVHGETWGKLFSALMRSPEGLSLLPGCAAYVVGQACEGLHAAHTALNENGEPLHIVHRDISPDNLLVGYDGGVRVLDFGVAHAEARLTNTRAGIVKGRLAYMAPEQARGESVDCRADVWSLGVLLREALERKRLFRRDTEAQTIMAVTHDPLPEWKAGVPEGLRAIADRALSRDVNARYASAREMAIELTAYLRAQPEPIGMAEVSARMDLVFKELKADKRAWMKQPIPPARKTVDLPKPRIPSAPAPGVVSSRSRVPSLGEAHNRAPQETLKLPAVQYDMAATQPRSGVDRTTWLALVVACLAAALVAGLWVNRYMSNSEPAPLPQVQIVGPQQPAQPVPAPQPQVQPQQPQ